MKIDTLLVSLSTAAVIVIPLEELLLWKVFLFIFTGTVISNSISSPVVSRTWLRILKDYFPQMFLAFIVSIFVNYLINVETEYEFLLLSLMSGICSTIFLMIFRFILYLLSFKTPESKGVFLNLIERILKKWIG